MKRFHSHRRDFLKLLALIPSVSMASLAYKTTDSPDARKPNIIIIVFDALSALNMSTYGYRRQTTPNIDRFAERAIVYQRHYSAGNFTTPGTASLLTGVYPWRHRGLHIYGTVRRAFEGANIFSAFEGSGYERVAYTHNDLANLLLHQFEPAIDELKATSDLCLFYEKQLSEGPFQGDHNAAFIGERALVRGGAGGGSPASLLYAMLHDVWRTRNVIVESRPYESAFPRGLPAETGSRLIFRLEDAIDWLARRLGVAEKPLLGYFHFYPPHRPYNTRDEFINLFADDWHPPEKPEHFFTKGHSQDELDVKRRLYDEYIAYADAEFGRLYDFMDGHGHLENSYLILTSDHGEMFERGILAHITETLYEPILRIPLIISRPGSDERVDVHPPTSSVDLLPTLTHLAGLESPGWVEGQVLEPFGGQASGGRQLFSVEAKSNPILGPLSKGTIALISDEHKLIRYMGYEGFPSRYEMYNVVADPQERDDLVPKDDATFKRLRAALESKLAEENRPFS